jgi:hypothetical protein
LCGCKGIQEADDRSRDTLNYIIQYAEKKMFAALPEAAVEGGRVKRGREPARFLCVAGAAAGLIRRLRSNYG